MKTKMRGRITALALSLAILSTNVILPISACAAKKPVKQPVLTVPTLKTTITQNSTHVDLTVGKAQIVKLSKPASRVSISDPEVIGIVLISPQEVELIGKKVGVANMLVWGDNQNQGYLTVDLSVNRDVSHLTRKIQMIDPGINILPIAAENAVILTGIAESNEKAQLAYDLAKALLNTEEKADATVSSDSAGSATLAPSSTNIINLIRVIGQPATKADFIQERLKDIDPNITLKVVPGFGGKEKAILTGRVKNAAAISKAINLASVFYGTPGIKVLTGPGGNTVAESKTENAQSTASTKTLSLLGNSTGNILHGSIMTDASGNVVSMLESEERPQVKCSIKFMEVTKSRDIELNASTRGFGRDARYTTFAGRHGQATTTDGDTVLLTDVSTFFNQINGNSLSELSINYGKEFASLLSGLVTTGRAKVLAEPNITAISGEPASFLAGGEFPIPLLGTNGGANVEFKEFGIRLNILATVTDRGTIHMQISPEVSTLDPASGINISGLVIPGLKTRRSQTVLEMKDGDNLVLSGLYNNSMSDVLSKTPLLGQIPIIGNLFRSKAFQKDETEMVIVIHPEIQTQMNLSSLEAPASDVKQVTQLNPDDYFKQLKDTATALTLKGNKDREKPKKHASQKAVSTETKTAQKPMTDTVTKIENNVDTKIQASEPSNDTVPLRTTPEKRSVQPSGAAGKISDATLVGAQTASRLEDAKKQLESILNTITTP